MSDKPLSGSTATTAMDLLTPRRRRMRTIIFLTISTTLALVFFLSQSDVPSTFLSWDTLKHHHHHHHHRPNHAHQLIARCKELKLQAGPPEDFARKRSVSDRFEEGTKPVLIKNAKIWTGGMNGTEVIHGEILLDKGLIKTVGFVDFRLLRGSGISEDLQVVDAKGSWVTPGIVDVHSHVGDSSSPALEGADDGNSLHGITQPWLRSLDGLNTHDDSYPLSIAGGVTTSLVLPGSANAIGGQAFVMKLRETEEKSPSSMLLEPPYNINVSFPNPNLPPRWRHMKHACGENPSRVYKGTRMDTVWAFREAYNTAAKQKEKQDEFCERVFDEDWKGLGDFPEVLQWEALVDVLRGKVKVNVHCYEAVDIDGMVRLSNEFKFPIAAFHHASEAYLVPDLIKKAYGDHPAIALFATQGRYKREAYRASEFAPRVLAQNGLTVVMKSDHPVMNSRYLLYEAQQAYFYGMPENLAIASVISNSAEVLGMGHRIGYVKEGYDADIVIWDSHPLALGATPRQVFIDGIPQLDHPKIVNKPKVYQQSPKVPNFDDEARKAVLYDGLPPLQPHRKPSPKDNTVVFTNVKQVFRRMDGGVVRQTFADGVDGSVGLQKRDEGERLFTVVTHKGKIVCQQSDDEGCASTLQALASASEGDSDIVPSPPVFVDLKGGSVSPGLLSFGSPLGLEAINQEPSTNDGNVFDPLRRPVPDILGGDESIVKSSDGLEFGTRDALLAYRFGVTLGVTAPSHRGFYGGLSTAFSLGAAHRLEQGAVVQEVAGLHVSVRHFGKPSVSTQIAALRHMLLGKHHGLSAEWLERVTKGQIPLVIEAHSADIIATLIILKQEVEAKTRNTLKMTITGASEAYILAKELAKADVGVILNPARPFPATWEQRRILPGPPITNRSAILELTSHGVMVGIGCQEIWEARNLAFDIGWAAIESGGRLSKEEAFAIGTSNMEKLLGVNIDDANIDLVATEGGDLLSFEGKVAAVISPQRGVSLFV